MNNAHNFFRLFLVNCGIQLYHLVQSPIRRDKISYPLVFNLPIAIHIIFSQSVKNILGESYHPLIRLYTIENKNASFFYEKLIKK